MSEEVEIREELDEVISDVREFSVLISTNINIIEKLGRDLLDRLMKIPGWEKMIKHCKEHYEQYPKEFFGWCYIEYYYYEPKIKFIKRYSGDDTDYIVLEIRLDRSLEEQVMELKGKPE